jgi:Ser-tRNA(Ala) deacylase AlaX
VTHELGRAGGNDKGVYAVAKDYNSHKADTLVVKVVENDLETQAEVMVLRKIGQLVDAGKSAIKGKEESVIVMRKIKGKPLEKIEAYGKADDATKKMMKSATRQKMHQKLADYAMNQGWIHA